MSNDEYDIHNGEHLMQLRLRCPALNYNTEDIFYCKPFLILHIKKKFSAEERNQKLSLNLEVATSSEAGDRLAHWITHIVS